MSCDCYTTKSACPVGSDYQTPDRFPQKYSVPGFQRNTAGMPGDDAASGRVQAELAMLNTVINDIEGSLGVLASRLDLVLQVQYPTEGGSGCEKADFDESSPLALTLRNLTARLHQQSCYLASLTGRLDI